MIKQTLELSLRSFGKSRFYFFDTKTRKKRCSHTLLRFWQNKLIGRDRNHGPRQKQDNQSMITVYFTRSTRCPSPLLCLFEDRKKPDSLRHRLNRSYTWQCDKDARQESWNGKLRINSDLGKKTTIFLSLTTIGEGGWF